MGLPQPLVDALRDIEQAEQFDFTETFRDGTEASLRNKLADFREIVQDLETRPARIKDAVHTLLENAGQEIAVGESFQEIDQAIEALFDHEEAMRKMLPFLEEVRELKAGPFSYPMAAEDKSLFVDVYDRWIRAFVKILESLRDLRWDLIAFRADAEDPGDAPVFDNPQDLLGYLKTLPK